MGVNERNLSRCDIWGVSLLILVVLGTHELPFTRLLDQIQKLINDDKITDQVIVQAGHTKYESNEMTIHQFVSYEEMERLYNQADLIISHAGTGSVLTGVKKGKKVIAVPRLERYNEHNDDHQLQLIDALGTQGHIIPCEDVEGLSSALQKVQAFHPKPFFSGKKKLYTILNTFINSR